jgi:hypothetical protein
VSLEVTVICDGCGEILGSAPYGAAAKARKDARDRDAGATTLRLAVASGVQGRDRGSRRHVAEDHRQAERQEQRLCLRLKLEVPQAGLLGQRALTAHNPRVTAGAAGAEGNEGEAAATILDFA